MNRCSICTAEFEASWRIPDRLYGGDEIFVVGRCAACGSTAVIQPPDDLAPFYPPTYYGDHTPGGRPPKLVVRRSSFLGRLLPRFWDVDGERLAERPGSILEVGSGAGQALDRYASHGWQTQGIEPGAAGVALARGRGHDVKQASIEEIDGLEPIHDVVRCRHVIEHTRDPLRTILVLMDGVRAGGHLLLEYPNPQGLPARLGRSRWWQLDPPRHLVIPAPSHIINLLKSRGFEVDYGTKTSGAGLANTILILLMPRVRPGWKLTDPKGRWFQLLARALEPIALLCDAFRAGDDIRLVARAPIPRET